MKSGKLVSKGCVSRAVFSLLTAFALPLLAGPGDVDPSFDPGTGTSGNFTGAVNALAVQADGKTVAGGVFTNYNGTDVPRFMRVEATGPLDAVFMANVGTGPNSEINAMILQPDGKILIGGDFNSYNGTTVRGIARINDNGTLDNMFMTTGNGVNSGGSLRYVADISFQTDGKILVSGAFFSMNGFSRICVARLNADGSVDTSFVPGNGPGYPNAVDSIRQLANGKIIVSGGFNSWNGVSVPNVARLNADGSLDLTFAPNFQSVGRINRVIEQGDGKLLLGGTIAPDFNPGTPSEFIKRLNPDGTVDTTFTAETTGWVGGDLLQEFDGKLLVAGIYTSVNGTPRGSLARLNLDGSLDTTFVTTNYAPNDGGYGTHFYSIDPTPDGDLMVGGWFTNVNGQAYNNIVRIENDTYTGPARVQFTSLGYAALENATNAVIRVVRLGTLGGAVSVDFTADAYPATPPFTATAGADFTATNGTLTWGPGEGGVKTFIVPIVDDNLVESNEVVRLTLSNPLGGITIGSSNTVALVIADEDAPPAIVLNPTNLVVNAGQAAIFQSAVVSIAPLSVQWYFNDVAVFNANTFQFIRNPAQLADAGNYYLVASNKNGLATSLVATLTVNLPPGSVNTNFVPLSVANFPAHAIHDFDFDADGRIVVGGDSHFSIATITNRIGRLNPNGTVDGTFNAFIGGSTYMRAIHVQPDGKIVAGGSFTNINGNTITNLVRVETNGVFDPSFSPSLASIFAVNQIIPVSEGRLLVSASRVVRRFLSNGSNDPSFALNTNNPPGTSPHLLAVRPDGKTWGASYNSGFPSTTFLYRFDTNGVIDLILTNVVEVDPRIFPLPDGGLYSKREFFGTNLFRHNANGVIVQTNTISGSGPYITTMHLDSSGRMLVGGNFTNWNGLPAPRMVRLNPDGTRDLSFNVGTGPNGVVNKIKTGPDGDIYVSGAFTSFNGVNRFGMARLKGGPSSLQFSVASVEVFENAGVLNVTVERVGGGSEDVGVTLSTVDGTAMSGVHYQGVTTNLTWLGTNQAPIVVAVPILDNMANGGDVMFSLQLTSPTNGAALGSPSALAVSIRDDEAPPLITQQPSGTAVNFLGTAMFSVEAFSVQPMTYQWRFNGTNLMNQTNPSLTLMNVQSNQAGLYSVLVSNPYGTTPSDAAQLLVLPPAGRRITNSLPSFAASVRSLSLNADGSLWVGGHFTSPRNRAAKVLNDGTLAAVAPSLGGTVETISAMPDGGALVGGTFTAGSRHMDRVKPDGTSDSGFNYLQNGPVLASVAQPDGKTIVGGQFGNLGGNIFNRIARINTNGTRDTFSIGNGFNTNVLAVALQPDGKIIAGGMFTTFDGSGAIRVMRLNANGSRDNSFAVGTGPNTNVNAVAVLPDGRVVIGGDFTTFNGTNITRIAVLTANGALDTSFNPGTGPSGSVFAVCVDVDGKILAGGDFTQVNGTNRTRIAKFNLDGSMDATFNAEGGFNSTVRAIIKAIDGGTWVGGDFTQVQGVNGVNRLAKLSGPVTPLPLPTIYLQPSNTVVAVSNAATLNVIALSSLPISYQWRRDGTNVPGANAAKLSFASAQYANGGLYDVVLTTTAGSVTSSVANLGIIGPPVMVDTNLLSGLGTDSIIYSLVADGMGGVLVGGSFFRFGSVTNPSFARLTPALMRDTTVTGVPQAWFIRDAFAVAPRFGGGVVAGGNYFTDGFTQPFLLGTTPMGALDGTFSNAPNNVVRAIVPDEDGYFVAGDFFQAGGVNRGRIARILSDGTVDLTWTNIGASASSINALLKQPDGKLIAGGSWNVLFNGVSTYDTTNSARRLIRMNPDGSIDTTFAPGLSSGTLNNNANALALQSDGKILVGGLFTTYTNGAVGRFVRLNTNGTVDTEFRLNTGTAATGTSGEVNAIAVDSMGRILVGGSFTNWNGQSANRLVRLLPNGLVDTVFNIGTGVNSGSVRAILPLPGGRVLIGGFFQSINGVAATNIALLTPADASTGPVIVQQPQNLDRLGGEMAVFNVTATGNSPTYQWRYNGTNLANGGRISGAGTAQLTITNLVRADSGAYSVEVTAAAQSVLSSNAVLTVRVPQLASAMLLGPGGLMVSFGDIGGGAPSSNDLPRFTVQCSTNMSNWTVLTNVLTWSNSMLHLLDTNTAGVERKFYRLIEQ